MADSKKPRLCEVLGVEADERFYIDGFEGECYVDKTGYFHKGNVNNPQSEMVGYALSKAINFPEFIKRKHGWANHSWSKQDIKDAKAVRRLFPGVESVERTQVGNWIYLLLPNGDHCGVLGRAGVDGRELFSTLKPGETVLLDEILGENSNG